MSAVTWFKRASYSARVGGAPAMMTGDSVSDSKERETEPDGKGYRTAIKCSSSRLLLLGRKRDSTRMSRSSSSEKLEELLSNSSRL